MAGKRTLTVEILGDEKDLSKTLKKTGADLDGFEKKTSATGSKIAGAIGGAFAVAGVAAFGGEMVSLGNQLEVIAIKSKTVFEGSEADVRSWAKSNAAAFGTTDDKLEGLAANFGDLLKPMGFTAAQAADMSTKVVGLSGALSAWSGGTRSAAEVSEILAKAMLGERDGLKELGISILDADVQGRLLQKGQEKLTGAALEQAKALATQELIFEKSADAQKAWADGSFDAQKKQNELKSRVAELKEQLASKLLPAFQAVVGVIVDKVIPAVSTITNFFSEHKAVTIAVAAVLGTITLGLIAYSVATTAATIATNLAAVATGIWTAAQWLLNVALTANPIGLVVVAIAALVAGIVLAYNKVDWFRDGVDALWGAFKSAFGWLQNNWPLVLAIITGPFGLAVLAISRHWDEIVGAVTGMPDRIRSAASGMWDGIKEAFRASINWIIDKWNQLEFGIPSVDTHIPGVGKVGGFTLGTPSIPRIHTGGTFHAPNPGGEGIALLRDGERISTPGTSGGVTVVVQGSLLLERDLLGILQKAKRQGMSNPWN